MCDQCTDKICEKCKSDYLVLSPDKTECWNKLSGCEIPIADQTWEFFDAGKKSLKDDNGFYICP